MGILEEILEANKLLSEQLTSLSSEVSLVKETINNYQTDDKLKMEFSDNEILNVSMTAKVLGIKQTELDDIIRKGMLHSVGERKRIFLAKDVSEYLRIKEAQSTYKATPETKRKKKRVIPVKKKLSQEQIAELVRINDKKQTEITVK